MSSYKNRNQIRQRSREPFDRRMDKWIQTGKQVVDGVAGNRPGQRKGGLQDRESPANFEKVGRWVEEKIDWFFEDDEDWSNHEDYDESLPEITTKKRPLSAISLRVPKALPPQIDAFTDNSDNLDEWPEENSFKIDKWERKDKLINQNYLDFNNLSPGDRNLKRKKNIPRSSRRKY